VVRGHEVVDRCVVDVVDQKTGAICRCAGSDDRDRPDLVAPGLDLRVAVGCSAHDVEVAAAGFDRFGGGVAETGVTVANPAQLELEERQQLGPDGQLDHHLVAQDHRRPKLPVAVVVAVGEGAEDLLVGRVVDPDLGRWWKMEPGEAEVDRQCLRCMDPVTPERPAVLQPIPGPDLSRRRDVERDRNRETRSKAVGLPLLVLEPDRLEVEHG